jgi:hypothetical protein
LRPSPNLVTDGAFGQQTLQAVRRFQADNWLVEDGIAGPCTQNALYGHETYTPILHDIPFIPQPTQTTCWAASTAMITNSTVPAVIARTPPDLIASDGGLRNFSNTDDAFTGAGRYAESQNIRLVSAASSLMLSYLRRLLQPGPLMFDMLWEPGKYIAGTGSPGHMVVLVGMRGDDQEDGKSTTIRIFDPWAPTIGNRSSFQYFAWANDVSTRTYHVFQK